MYQRNKRQREINRGSKTFLKLFVLQGSTGVCRGKFSIETNLSISISSEMKRKPEKESIDMEEGDSSDSTSSEDEVEEYSEEEGTSEATELTKDKSVGRKKAKSSLPTKDEQLQLNNTDSLLRSNLLKLQIDEMLGEVSCEAVLNKKKVQNSIKECMSILQSIGDTKYNGKEMTSFWLKKEGLV